MRVKTRKVILIIVAIIAIAILSAIYISTNNSTENSMLYPSPSPTTTTIPAFTPTPTLIPTPTIRVLPTINANTPQTLDQLFSKYGAIYNVDPNVLRKIAGCESGYDVNQVTGDYAGLFQFASFAWIEARGRMGLSNDQSLRFNAEESVKTAAFEINYKGTSGWDDCD
jgi:hypothetical protein